MFVVRLIQKFLLIIFLFVVGTFVCIETASAARFTAHSTSTPFTIAPSSTHYTVQREESQRQASVHYVSKNGSNADGQTWQSAWNELNQIKWDQIQPGDTILIDGGPVEMTYTTAMEIGASGSSDAPIWIQASSEDGRNGKITLFGGRYKALPHCFQSDYDNQEDEILKFGIRTNDHSWLILDGLDWRGIVIHGYSRAGIRIDRHSQNITIRNVEIYNNGYAKSTYRGWMPEGVGIRLAGPNMLVERSIIHDNGQDAIQSLWDDNNIRDFRINQSWLYNGRRHLTVDESWNYCSHTDGLQIYDGGYISGITVEESVVGPGFTHGLILGQTRAGNGAQADVHHVTVRNSLFTKAADNGIFGYEGSNTHHWTIDRVTMHCSNTKWHCITLDNSSHSVTNSIFVGSRLTFEQGLNNYDNNCIWQTSGLEIGKQRNPLFVNVSDSDNFSLDDYSLQSASPCKGRGSSITSVNALLGTADVTLIPNPTLPPDQTPPQETTPPSVILPPPSTPGETVSPSDPPSGGPSEQNGALLNAGNMNAADGEVSESFSLENGAIFQSFDVPTAVGSALASYRFYVGATGYYQVDAVVQAESESYNSIFIDIDNEPTIDYMIWDIPVTQGFQTRTVAWRGNGTFNRSEFTPKYFHLNAGEHVLYIRGRESYTYLKQFSIQPAADAVESPVIRPQIELTPLLYLPLVTEQ